MELAVTTHGRVPVHTGHSWDPNPNPMARASWLCPGGDRPQGGEEEAPEREPQGRYREGTGPHRGQQGCAEETGQRGASVVG